MKKYILTMFIKIPNYGEIATKSVVGKIYKKVGDFVDSNEIILDIETEKAMLEINSFYSGKIIKILVKSGDEVLVGQNIIEIKTDEIIKKEPEQIIEKVKISKLRKTISDRLKYAQNNAAIVTTFNEVDMTNIISIRNENKKNNIKIGLMPFFIKATANVLPKFKSVNAQIKNDYILYKKYYNIGFAVDINDGLFVSVIKNADKLTIYEIAAKIENLKKTVDSDDCGTFTITNGGVYGSLFSTPIINATQSGILGINSIIERPIALNGNVFIKPMMYISLSYDHRIMDGKEAIEFLIAVKNNLENISMQH
jgi:pyruvate/2-oxoglutarate dehydrogenase complex dihydrolipoamide acyltransferase (E2) component